MEWVVLEEVASAELFGSLVEPNTIAAGSPSFGLVLLTRYLEYLEDNRATKTNSFVDSIIRGDQAHPYLIFAITLFWLNVKNISLYQVLLCVSLITTGLYLFVNYIAFQFLYDDIKWIRRELRLLRAIGEDAAAITPLSDQIKTKARHFWESELNSSTITVGLTESEVAWVGQMKLVALEAEDLIKVFESRRNELMSRTMSLPFSSVLLDYMKIEELFLKTRQVKDGINSITGKKEAHKIHICESVENSWSVIRKLLDRPIEQHDNEWVKSILQVDPDELISSLLETVDTTIKMFNPIKSLGIIEGNTVELQLLLLYPFLQYIEGLHLESKIAKAWLSEVNEIASEAKVAIGTFLEVTANQYRWLRVLNIHSSWKSRRKLKADLKCIEVGFSDLFQRKERYGFKFIIRDSSKSNHQDYWSTYYKEKILVYVKSIRISLIRRLQQLGWVYNKLRSLCDQLEGICKLFDKADIINIGEDWLKEIEKIANLAGKHDQLWNMRATLQLSWDIDKTKHHIYHLERSIRTFEVELRESSSVVGLEEDIEEVVSELKIGVVDHQDCSDIRIVKIVGRKGIGKTTLAKEIYSHRAVVNRFPVRVWISVPQNCNDKLPFLEAVAKQVPEINSEQLEDFIQNNKYFLVLDNVSTKEAWVTLKEMLLPKSDGSRILLTTHNEDVTTIDDSNISSTLHRVRLRTKDESLSLLKQMVYISPEEGTVAQDIVSGCFGLPLSIVRYAYMMLKQAAKASDALAMLMRSFEETKELPPRLKKLLQHFELFPRDFDIPARRLVTLWVSEGLIEKGTVETETLEQVAEKSLSELVDLGIVQIVKKKASGKVKTCYLPVRTKPRELEFSHDPQHKCDRVRSVQRLAYYFNKSRLGFCLIHSDGLSDDELKTLYFCPPYDPGDGDEVREYLGSFRHTGPEVLDNGSDNFFRLDYRNLRCFHTFDPREGDEPGETIGKFLRNGIKRGVFQQLQVLDLERTFKPELPNSIGQLKKLKYLGLRWTYLQSIPSSIGDLVHLETLDVKQTYVRTLPSSVWKLQGLRNLYLSHSKRCKFVRQPRGSFLKNLRTLWGVFVDEDSPLKDCLDKLIDLRKLGMVFQLDVSKQQRLLSPWISKLNHLQTLRLRSIDERGKPDKLFVNLSSLENLSSIELFGRLENPLIIAELPQKLTELTLSASGLIDDPLPKLEKLPNLKLLCFYSNSYKGRRMVCSDEGFPKLVVLKIWKLEELEELIVQEKALQSLRELEIRACTKLIIPYGLKNLKMLLELKLTDMPDEFARKIENDRRQIWSNNTHSPTINILHQS